MSNTIPAVRRTKVSLKVTKSETKCLKMIDKQMFDMI